MNMLPCSSLSRNDVSKLNLAAVFQVCKPCRSSLEGVPQVCQITNFKLCYTRNTHYESVVALDGGLCSKFPTLQTSAVETDTIVV